jgi:hypothetical protein
LRRTIPRGLHSSTTFWMRPTLQADEEIRN